MFASSQHADASLMCEGCAGTSRKACKRKARRGSPIMKRLASCEEQRCRVMGKNGDIAQLGERVLCKHEVVGSIPSVSTKPSVCCRQPVLSLARPRTFGPAGVAGVSTKCVIRHGLEGFGVVRVDHSSVERLRQTRCSCYHPEEN